MTSSSNSSDQKLSRGALIALVVGSMVGSGIFALPSAFARASVCVADPKRLLRQVG